MMKVILVISKVVLLQFFVLAIMFACENKKSDSESYVTQESLLVDVRRPSLKEVNQFLGKNIQELISHCNEIKNYTQSEGSYIVIDDDNPYKIHEDYYISIDDGNLYKIRVDANDIILNYSLIDNSLRGFSDPSVFEQADRILQDSLRPVP